MSHSFLLLHGAFHGAWCWAKVIPLLRARGHGVHAIDLPGHGEDRSDPNGLRQQDYTDAVVSYCEEHDLRGLVLVGHSAAGATLTLAAPQLQGRIASLVFLAAVVPRAGESLMQCVAPGSVREFEAQLSRPGQHTFLPDRERAKRMFLGGLSPGEQERAWKRLTPEPLGPYMEPVLSEAFDPDQYRRHYVTCTGDTALAAPQSRLFAERLGVIPRGLASGHCPMLSSPKALASLLLDGLP